MFSILIPSWNNLAYLKLCIESIQKNSAFNHEIIVHVNEGTDGTINYLDQQNIPYTHSTSNVGVCKALNQAYTKSTKDYIVYMNDDMYALPNWDLHLWNAIQKIDSPLWYLSSTMIEPKDTGNPCVLVADYGTSVESFNEQQLLYDAETFHKEDWNGSTWPPSILQREHWDLIGGYSELFTPGMSSDDDFSMKLWEAGCRWYQGVGNSLVYHFQTKSTGRIVKNNGPLQFLELWGITQSTFTKQYLHRGHPFKGALPEPSKWVKAWAFAKGKFKWLTR
jgi:glycosyltransferase involved in cell wall biosynthesis